MTTEKSPDKRTQAAVRSGVLMTLFQVASTYWPDTGALIPAKNTAVQLRGGSVKRRLAVKNGKVHEPDSSGFFPAAISLVFPGEQAMARKLSGGDAAVIPVPRGIKLISALIFFTGLSGRISEIMAAEFDSSSEHYQAQTKMLLCAALRGVCEVGMYDSWVAVKASHLPLACLEVVAGDPAAPEYSGFIVSEEGYTPNGRTLTFIPEMHADKTFRADHRPAARLVFANLDIAGAVLRGKLNAMDALGDGSIRIQGKLPFIQGIFPLLDRFSAVMSTPA